MDNENEMAYKRINITLPPDVYEKLVRISGKEDRPISNVIKRMIQEYNENKQLMIPTMKKVFLT